MRHVKLSIAAVAAAAGMALSASSAHAQDIQWAAAVDGNWTDSTKWNPMNVPDNFGEKALFTINGNYTASVNGTLGIGGLSITKASPKVGVLDGVTFFIAGDVVNKGTIIINSAGGVNNATLRFDGGDRSLTGTGKVLLVLGSSDLNDAILSTNGATLTQGAGHTIHGAGNIYAALTNNGTVLADVNGSTLQLLSGAETNNALIKAAAGATLQINSIIVTQGAQGVIQAADGLVNLIAATVVGGTLETSGTGDVRASGVCSVNAVTSQGAMGVNDGSFILVHDGLTNNGVITVNPDQGVNNATLRFDGGDQTLGGTGEVLLVLGSSDLNDAVISTNGATLTQDVDHLIHGAGNIYAALTNNGTVLADINGGTLQLLSSAETNNALIKAAAGATLQINSIVVTQGAQGVIQAADGLVNLIGATVVGGTLETSGTGDVRALGVCSVNAVTSQGAMGVNDGSFIMVHDGLTNNGVITVNPDQGVNNATLRFDGNDQTLGGTGEVLLVLGSSDLNDAAFSTNGGTVTQDVDHLIHGAGNVYAALINNGTVLSDVNGGTLQLLSSAKTNNALMKAAAGATLQIASIAVTQGAQGVIQAEDGRVNIISATVAGGTLETSGTGDFRASGVSNADAVTNQGALGVGDDSFLLVHGGMTNNGVITVNPDLGINNSDLRFDGGDQTLGGTGEVVLKLGSGDLNDAQIGTNGGTLTIGPSQTIRGSGRFTGGNLVTVQGTLAPGESVGQFDVSGPITLDASAAYDAEIAAPDSFDQITVSGTATLGGALNISLLNGFAPDTCLVVPLVTATSIQGEFDSVQGDPGQGRVWRVAYTATQAKAFVTCYPDFAVDCKLDLFDFLEFVNLFNAGDLVTDCTKDGSLDLFDFLCFVNAFNHGC